jgi:hypothetical protein
MMKSLNMLDQFTPSLDHQLEIVDTLTLSDSQDLFRNLYLYFLFNLKYLCKNI